MNPRNILAKLIAAALPFLAAASSIGQTATAPATVAAPAPSEREVFIQQLKRPASWLTWGADFRVRNEYYNNIVTLADAPLHEQDLFRLRGRVSASFAVAPDFTFNTRVAMESRQWQKPAFVGAFKAQTGFEQRFLVADNFNAKWTNLFDGAGTLTIGRQDIMLGDPLDWWLVMDGTPNEGSWTTYFDAVRLSVEARSIETKFDVIALREDVQPDEWLPTLGDSDSYPVTDQKEQGVILYASNKSLAKTQVDAYYLYKHDEQQRVTVAGATRLSGDNADLHTFGAKITGTPTTHLSYSFEGALQFGTKEDRILGVFAERDVEAWGGKGKVTYAFNDPLSQKLFVSGELLSGDDASTSGKDEMFDVLWGRWPLWSELYIYSVIPETGGRVAQMNNLGRIGGGWACVPAKGATASLTYQALFALERTPTRATAPALFSRDGDFRGHFVQAVVKRQFNKYLSGHLWAEWVWQGDYYTNREVLTFLRAELMIGF
jgi:hypothetical protein